jgi:UDP-N-acetylmuramoyl-L-alanyl-D-glutamate--2,6-diaminopimelate ligase
MQLSVLLERLLIKQVYGDNSFDIKGIETDSRKAKPGDLFICLTGLTLDGHSFASDAISRGAIAILVEKELTDTPCHVTVIKVPDTRRAMAILADYFYGQPSKVLKLIGVTGTNGKTTTTHLIEKILNDSGKKTGLIGTIHMKIGDYTEKAVNTTPEAIDLQRFLRKMIENGAEYTVLEVSSHALAMGRVRGCNFSTAIFTNLTHDHLDYHQTLENYCQAKSLLFSQLGNSFDSDSPIAVFNIDDEASDNLAKKTSAQIIRYGIKNNADVQAKDITFNREGTSLTVETFKGSLSLNLKMQGLFNVYNVLAAISACLLEGVTLEQMKESLESFEGIRGRFQHLFAGQDFTVIVDYAHNPDGLENVLRTARQFTLGKLYCVVGCEGDRDRKKRPVMAHIAATYSDIAIFTSDNTRSEDPEFIIKEMVEGLECDQMLEQRIITILNRKEAIHHAVKMASDSKDCIIITGKGHETHQLVKNKMIPFDDVEVASEIIENILSLQKVPATVD